MAKSQNKQLDLETIQSWRIEIAELLVHLRGNDGPGNIPKLNERGIPYDYPSEIPIELLEDCKDALYFEKVMMHRLGSEAYLSSLCGHEKALLYRKALLSLETELEKSKNTPITWRKSKRIYEKALLDAAKEFLLTEKAKKDSEEIAQFTRPELPDVKDYVQKNDYKFDCNMFYRLNEAQNWRDDKGNAIINWQNEADRWQKLYTALEKASEKEIT